MATPAPACKAALAEATTLYPQRSRASDGIMGDPAHQARVSDHNDGNAFDLTHDPLHGCDAHALVRALVQRRDRRVKYAISQGRIWSAARATEGWRPYSGTNPHNKHAHVSIYVEARNSTGPWWASGAAAAPATPHLAPERRPVVVHNHVRTLVAPNGGLWHLQADGGIITATDGAESPEATYYGSIPEPGDAAVLPAGSVAIDLVPFRGGYSIVVRHTGDVVTTYLFPAGAQ